MSSSGTKRSDPTASTDADGSGWENFFDPSKTQRRRSMVLLSLGALLGLLVAGYGLFTAKGTRSHWVPPEDLALVNSRPILRSDFMTQVETQFTLAFAQSTPAQRKQVLEDMLTEELLVQRGLEMDLPSFDPDVRSAMGAGVELEISADVLAQQPTEQQLHAYYASHMSKYRSAGWVRIRDLVAKRPGAQTMAQAISTAQRAVAALRGAAPLEQVVERYRMEDSGALLDAGHVDTGQIFEFAAKAKLGADVYAAAANLQAGQVSDPIRQSDGAHVVVMVEHQLPVQEDFAGAADQVWADFKKDALARGRDAEVRYLRSRADILLSDDASALEVHGP
jgi:parvulin-like peptidyl-prolyl isomerase